jgi:hypothetical protein
MTLKEIVQSTGTPYNTVNYLAYKLGFGSGRCGKPAILSETQGAILAEAIKNKGAPYKKNKKTLKEVVEITGAAYRTVARYAQEAGWSQNKKTIYLDEEQFARIVEAVKRRSIKYILHKSGKETAAPVTPPHKAAVTPPQDWGRTWQAVSVDRTWGRLLRIPDSVKFGQEFIGGK